MLKKIKVLVVDDSATVRNILKKGLSTDPQLEVVGTAPDVYVARDKIIYKKPDVITLDIEMPRMDGIEFLKRLMPQYPLPVVIVSALAEQGAKATLDALEYGAVDFVLKPSLKLGSKLADMMDELQRKVKIAARVDVSRWQQPDYRPKKRSTSKVLVGTTDKVIAIGASTGGTVAIRQIINEYPPDMPGTVIVQHMPPIFTRLFAEKLNDTARVEVKEAENGERILTGKVLIAPGDQHLQVVRSGGNYLARCQDGEKVNGHCPSVEVLFQSMARNVGSNSLGVILTGMGRDGATGLLAMRQAGARTFAQDEQSSVVFGMPREAYQCGGAERLVALRKMGSTLIKTLKEMQ